MKNNSKLISFCVWVGFFAAIFYTQAQTSAVYGGGGFYSGGQAVMDDLRQSGFNTVILWTIHVSDQGNMNFNDIPVIDTNGNYIGDPDWTNRIATLKQNPTSVTRVELGIASAGATDFENIELLINQNGTGPNTVLYKAFENLKAVTAADAVNFDDESNYDVSTTVQFAVMLADIGFKVTLVPYTRISFWREVYNRVEAQRPGTIDKVYLQVYAGGAGNNPADWNGSFGNLKVIPGLWSKHGSNCNLGSSPAQVQSRMSRWKPVVSGGFMWLYDDIEACSAPGQRTSDYASAINNALATTPPSPTGTINIAPNANITVSSEYIDPNWSKEKLTDNIIGQNANGEWASGGEQTPYAQLTWNQTVKVNKIVLYDRPNSIEKINSGVLTFSDGSTINVSSLPDNGTAKEITFEPKDITSVRFQVTNGVGPNVGLSEFQVFGSLITTTPQGCSDCVDFNSVRLNSYSNQDAVGTNFIEDNGATARLVNNTWKRSNRTYTITPNTVVSFEFKSTSQGEIHGIGFDEDNGLSSNRIFKVHGTQGWGIRTYDTYNGSGGYVSYTIPVGNFYTGGAMNLILVNDNDRGSGNNSSFKNIRVYQNAGLKSNITNSGTIKNETDDELYSSLSSIQLYPNPFVTHFSIKLPEGGARYTNAILYDIAGRQIAEQPIGAKQKFMRFETLQNLKKGMYILQLKGGETTKILKILKN